MSKTRKWYAKGLYVVFALALLVGLSVVPVSAATAVTNVNVSLGDDDISTASAYTITFDVTTLLPKGASDWIEVRFPSDTTVPTGTWTNAHITIAHEAGLGGEAEPIAVPVGSNATTTTRTVKILLTQLTKATGAGAMVQVIFLVGGNVKNPSAVGDYTLEVRTSKDTTWVTSAAYSIKAPETGTVSVYNDAAVPVLMKTYSGAGALASCETDGWLAKPNYTIEVGPGTYTPSSHLTLNGKGLTFKGANYGVSPVTETRGAESIISSTATDDIVWLAADDVTIDGFTFDGNSSGGMGIYGSQTGFTIQNNKFIEITSGANINLETSGNAVTSGIIDSNTFIGEEPHAQGIIVSTSDSGANNMSGVTISNNALSSFGTADMTLISLATGTSSAKLSNITVTGNTVTDCSSNGYGFTLWHGGGSSAMENIDVTNNTFSECKNGIRIKGAAPTDLTITGNDITDNKGVGILIDYWTPASCVIKFNNITDNDTTHGYGLQNATTGAVDATHNWWGSAVSSEIAAMIYNSGTGATTDYTPFLTDTVESVFSATAVDTSKASLNASTTVGAYVLTSGITNNVIGAAKYIANPGAPIDNALAFYDVYVTGTSIGDAATDTATLRFYAEDADAYDNGVLYAWSSSTATWVAVSPAAVFNDFGGFLYVTLNTTLATTPSTPLISDLTGLPFAVCGVAVIDVAYYDEDGSGLIEIDELLNAISDYIGGVPGADISLLLNVISAYINETAV